MARKATGTKEWRPTLKTWVGRVWIDGVRTKWHDLCTDDETIADKRLGEWLRTGEPPSPAGKETFAAAAERILREQQDRAATANRRHRIRAYALPLIGHIEIAQLKPPHVHSVLVGMEKQRRDLAERALKLGAATVARESGLAAATVEQWMRQVKPRMARAELRGEEKEHKEIAERATKVGAAKVAEELDLVEATVEKWVRALAEDQLGSFSVDTVHHMRVDISRILGALVLEGAIERNVAEKVELPDAVEYDDRPFVVFTDEEVARFFRRGFDSQLMMACLLSREVGAQRTSDLLASDYEDYDLVNFQARVRRPKTDDQGSTKFKKRRKRRVTLMYERVWLKIPEPVRGPLLAWREKHRDPITGELPTKGPLFPAQKGKNAGKRKSSRGNSWAKALRDALWEEGIVRPLPGYETAVGEERRKFCALQVDTDYSRKAVFHSFRRASVTALRKAGVPVRIAMLITGHASLPTHMGYDALDDALEIPAESLASYGAAASPSPSTTLPPGAPAIEREGTPAGAPAAATGTATPVHRATALLEGAAGPRATEAAPAAAVAPEPAAPESAQALASDVRPPPADAGLGQELIRTPSADLAGAPLPGAGLHELLAQLVDVLRGGGLSAGYSPNRGLNELDGGANSPQNPQGFPRRARQDSNLRPTAPEGACDIPSARNNPDEGAAEPTDSAPSDPVLARSAGHSQAPPSPLEQLKAAAHGFLEEGKLDLVRALMPLIEAEQKQAAAAAPISLEAVRRSRGAK